MGDHPPPRRNTSYAEYVSQAHRAHQRALDRLARSGWRGRNGNLYRPKEADIDDAIQNAFERFLIGIKQKNPWMLGIILDHSPEDDMVLAMLWRLTKLRYIDILRKRKEINMTDIELLSIDGEALGKISVEFCIDSLELVRRLFQANYLSDEEKIIIKYTITGMSDEEIATRLSLSESTIRNKKTLIRNKIRDLGGEF